MSNPKRSDVLTDLNLYQKSSDSKSISLNIYRYLREYFPTLSSRVRNPKAEVKISVKGQ